MTGLATDIARLLESGGAIDREALAGRAMRYLERWTPPGQEREMAEMVAADLAAEGAEVEIDEEFPGSPSVIARVRGPEPGPTIQWHGHLDTIATEHPPARRDGDELVARGASDMKGAIAANVTSLQLLREAGLPRRGQVLLTYHGLHEEGGSAPLIRLIERGILGDAVMTGELGSGRELVTASRGLDFWMIEVHRDGRSIHEVNAPPGLVDPLRVGTNLLERLVAIREGLVAGTMSPPGSLFIGMFRAGDYYNRVPTSCTISGTRRHLAGGSHAEVHAELEGLVEKVRRDSGAAIELRITTMTDAYSIDPDERVSQALRIAHERLTGERMVAVTSGAAGNAADFVVGAGIPAVYYGCDYASAHSDRESTTVDQLVRVAAGFAIATAAYLSVDALEPPPLDRA